MESVTIMLLPDSAYKSARSKITGHHLTVAYFGMKSTISTQSLARLRNTIDTLARSTSGPIPAKANGVGIFDAGRSGIAVVDLIDGIGTFFVRSRVESLFGVNRTGYTLDDVKIDYTHGFTPHITREFLDREDNFYGEVVPEMVDNLEFTFTAIGLWAGDERYEVSL